MEQRTEQDLLGSIYNDVCHLQEKRVRLPKPPPPMHISHADIYIASGPYLYKVYSVNQPTKTETFVG